MLHKRHLLRLHGQKVGLEVRILDAMSSIGSPVSIRLSPIHAGGAALLQLLQVHQIAHLDLLMCLVLLGR